MALAATSPNSVTVSSATQSDHIHLPPGHDYVLSFTSAGAFVLDVQIMAGDGSSFDDVYDGTNTKVAIDSSTGVQNVVVRGGQSYRMDVTTYNNPITMWAKQA